jgi:hypothetical protein
MTRPLKRGVAIPPDVADYAFELARICGVRENRVYVRLMQIGKQDLAPFEGNALATLIKDPWEVAKQLPSLKRQLEQRSHGRLNSIAALRLTVADYVALREFAKKHKTTISASLRQIVHRILATEAK